MNYRHAFHAGNFADVMKHVVLVRILVHLLKKPSPFRVIDTHAGIGVYDLSADEARRTGEWREGVGRLGEPFPPVVEDLLRPYRDVLDRTLARFGPSAYPGSPGIVGEMLRRDDRAVFNELHPDDAEALAATARAFRRAKVLRLDGWTALHALIPPKERRGLVLIDPPYEERDELARLARELLKGVAKWPTGIFAAWYPVKDRAGIEAMLEALRDGLDREALRLELLVAEPDPGRLHGSGLVVVNPPWTLAADADVILPALAGRMGAGGADAFRCEPLRSSVAGEALGSQAGRG